METNELFRRCEDLRARCERTGAVTAAPFLTPAEQRLLSGRYAADGDAALFFDGGAEGCERQRAFFLPWYMAPGDLVREEHIRCVAFRSSFGTPEHRDYLGAALGLGIRREWLGDVRLRDGECWIFCAPTVEPLLMELDRAGRISVKASACPLSDVPPVERRAQERSFTVQSPRLDAVAAGLFRLSRTAAAEQIRLGLVSLNYLPCLRPDQEVREGDVISLRGRGKGSVTEIGGRSRKDRLFVTAERLL